MKLKKKEWQQLACGLMIAAFLAILAAAWGFLSTDLWLASTQWLQVATALGIFGVYAQLKA